MLRDDILLGTHLHEVNRHLVGDLDHEERPVPLGRGTPSISDMKVAEAWASWA